MVLPISPNPISASNINVELSQAETSTLNINDQIVRELFVGYTTDQNSPLFTTNSQISYTDGYGKEAPFRVAISSNTNDVNVRNFAISQGWDQNKWVILTIDTGVVVSSTSAGANYALTVNGSFPKGLTIINNGTILGRGGNGGNGGGSTGTTSATLAGGAGGAGGRGIIASVPCVIVNNGTIAGGGGGGAGGIGVTGSVSSDRTWSGGGGGGGGAGNGTAGNSGTNARSNTGIVWIQTAAQNGVNGTATTGGNGGNGGGVTSQTSGGTGILIISSGRNNGGAGGERGASGSNSANFSGTAGQILIFGPTGIGGAGGNAIDGMSNITFWETGTILGPTT